MIIDLLVEGKIDEIVGRKIIEFCDFQPGVVYGNQGWQYIQSKLPGFSVRAQYGNPILTLVDFMDTGLACPPSITNWLPDPHPRLLLRTVVNEIESWLLADREAIAAYLRISVKHVPEFPEQIPDPKQTLVNLARRKSRRRLNRDLIPPQGISGVVGPGYTYRTHEFIQNYWDVERAAANAPSLKRCVKRLRALA